MDSKIIFFRGGGALPRQACSGVSMSAGRSSDSAVIDSRYKPAWHRDS
jgi:hypothetical protein